VTRDEIIKLLQIAAAYDNRTIADAATHAWADAAHRCRWTYPEAADAIKAHYAEATEFVMPAHVTRRIRAVRQDLAMRNPTDPPDKAGQDRLARMLAGAFKRVGDD
jgi:hypothetical protein